MKAGITRLNTILKVFTAYSKQYFQAYITLYFSRSINIHRATGNYSNLKVLLYFAYFCYMCHDWQVKFHKNGHTATWKEPILFRSCRINGYTEFSTISIMRTEFSTINIGEWPVCADEYFLGFQTCDWYQKMSY